MHFKTLKNKKAVSPIIATLLLILIAVAAGVIIYVWTTGYIGTQIGTAGGQETFVITNVKYYKNSSIDYLDVTIINQGAVAITIDTSATPPSIIRVFNSSNNLVATGSSSVTINPGEAKTFTVMLKLQGSFTIAKGHSYVLEVTTVKGNTAVYTFTA